MEVYEAILAKRDRRSYDLSRQVPEDIIDRLLQAGRMAGSSKNEQPIRAIILTDSEIKASLSRTLLPDATGAGVAISSSALDMLNYVYHQYKNEVDRMLVQRRMENA